MGHYYAYAKNDEDKMWYEFNDTQVSLMDPPDNVHHLFNSIEFNILIFL